MVVKGMGSVGSWTEVNTKSVKKMWGFTVQEFTEQRGTFK